MSSGIDFKGLKTGNSTQPVPELYPAAAFSRAHLSADLVIVLVHDGHGPLLARHRLVVGVGQLQRVGVTSAAAVVLDRRALLGPHELSGELDAPPHVVVAPAPLERAVRLLRVGAASAARQHAGRAVPGHGVRQRGRTERVHERLFFGACSENGRVMIMFNILRIYNEHNIIRRNVRGARAGFKPFRPLYN